MQRLHRSFRSQKKVVVTEKWPVTFRSFVFSPRRMYLYPNEKQKHLLFVGRQRHAFAAREEIFKGAGSGAGIERKSRITLQLGMCYDSNVNPT